MRYEYKIPLVPPSNNKYIGNGGQSKNLEYQAEKRQWAGYINIFLPSEASEGSRQGESDIALFFQGQSPARS